VGTGQVGSTTPRGTVVLRSVIVPGMGGTSVVVVVVVLVVVVVGTVVAVGSTGTVSVGAEV